jgi:Uma2 family endonuclease
MRSMTPATSRPRKTIDDLMALPDGVRAELVEGEIYVTPAPNLPHQDAVVRLWQALDAWAAAVGGTAVVGPNVEFPSGDVVEPDVVLVAAGRRRFLCKWGVRGVPNLVVEVVSPSHPSHDRYMKRDLYARNGVPEYWIADPDEAGIEVLRLEEGSYVAAGYYRRGATLLSPTLPGLAIAVDGVFRLLDAL